MSTTTTKKVVKKAKPKTKVKPISGLIKGITPEFQIELLDVMKDIRDWGEMMPMGTGKRDMKDFEEELKEAKREGFKLLIPYGSDRKTGFYAAYNEKAKIIKPSASFKKEFKEFTTNLLNFEVHPVKDYMKGDTSPYRGRRRCLGRITAPGKRRLYLYGVYED